MKTKLHKYGHLHIHVWINLKYIEQIYNLCAQIILSHYRKLWRWDQGMNITLIDRFHNWTTQDLIQYASQNKHDKQAGSALYHAQTCQASIWWFVSFATLLTLDKTYLEAPGGGGRPLQLTFIPNDFGKLKFMAERRGLQTPPFPKWCSYTTTIYDYATLIQARVCILR